MRATAGNKLTVIADQIRYLQEQAKKVRSEKNCQQTLGNDLEVRFQRYYIEFQL